MEASNNPVAKQPATNSQSVAGIAKETWSLYLRHAQTFLGYSAWLLVPMALSVLLSLGFGEEGLVVVSLINTTLGLVISTWLTIVIIKIIPILREEKRIRSRRISQQAWKLFLPYLFLSIAVNIVTGIGIVLLIIPGIVAAVRLSYAQILVVRETMEPWEAIKTSLKRTQGQTWKLSKRLIGGVLTVGLPYLILAVAMIMLFAAGRDLDPLTFFMEAQPTLLEIVSFQFLDILFLPALLIYWVLMYEKIR